MYTYIRTEPGLWTVGFYREGDFESESDHGSTAEAAERCHYLNGGCSAEDEDQAIVELRQEIRRLQDRIAELESRPMSAPPASGRSNPGPGFPLGRNQWEDGQHADEPLPSIYAQPAEAGESEDALGIPGLTSTEADEFLGGAS